MLQVNNYPTDGGNDRVDVGRSCVPFRYDWWVHLSLPSLSSAFFTPLLLWKWIAPVKWRNHALKKKTVFTIPQRHIYFILKGRFEVTLHSFPSDIFQLDILWHFQLNIADIPAEELKACLKGTSALKALSLSLSTLLLHSFLLSPSLSLHHEHSSSSCSNTNLHALPSKCGWLASSGIRGSHFNPKGLPKILSPRIYSSVWLKSAYDAILSRNSKIKMQ